MSFLSLTYYFLFFFNIILCFQTFGLSYESSLACFVTLDAKLMLLKPEVRVVIAVHPADSFELFL